MNTETKQRLEGMKKMVWVSLKPEFKHNPISNQMVFSHFSGQGTYSRSLHGPIGQPKRKTNSERRQEMRAIITATWKN